LSNIGTLFFYHKCKEEYIKLGVMKLVLIRVIIIRKK